MQIRTLEYRRLREAAGVLAEAYAREPIIERMIPVGVVDRGHKVADFFVWSMLLTGLDTVDVAIDPLDDRIVGVALWEPPAHRPHTWMAAVAKPGVLLGIGRAGLDTLEAFDAASEGKHPQGAWHLVDIGALSRTRGMGVGTQLLEHRLAMIDRAGQRASLEATTAESAKLYERHGFERMHDLTGVAEGVCVMWREPATGERAA